MDHSDRLFWIVTGALGAAVTAVTMVVLASAPAPQASGGMHREARPAPAPREQQPHRQGSRYSLSAVIKRNQVFASVQGDGAFSRLGEPRPGDWLWSFHESGQTLHDYARTVTNRKTRQRNTIHIQPYADLDPGQRWLVPRLEQFVAAFFQTRVKRLPCRTPSSSWWVSRRQQYDADVVVRQLSRRVGPRSLGILGLLGKDMYAGNLYFVFGLALLHDRACVHSLHRYGANRDLQLLRTLKMSAHELGHIFGIHHCVFYRCVMNGANSINESDGAPLHLCPACLAKLQWNLGFDAHKRYRQLAAFYGKVGLHHEAAFVAARAPEVAQ